MRLPQTPPDINKMLGLLETEKDNSIIRAALSHVSGPMVDGRYLHWEELRRREHPAGIKPEVWWFGLKIYRRGSCKHVPLRDKQGAQFSYVLVDPIHEGLHHIDQEAAGRIQMPEQVTSEEVKNRYYVNSLIEEATTSSLLEGATSTRPVAKEMIRTGRSPRDRSERMILNNYRTMQSIGRFKEEKLSRKLIFEIHELITEGTLDDPGAAGRFRREGEERAVMSYEGEIYHVPPPVEQLEERLEKMCAFANSDTPGFIHPVVRSIILHFWLAYDHPFVEGNGRTARALFYWSMLRHGYWLFEFISISNVLLKAPSKYGRAFLYTETDDNDLTYFVLHQIDVMSQAILELHRYLERKSREVHDLEMRIRGITMFNVRQRALLSNALRNPRQVYTFQSHQTSWNVVYQTARSDLLHLHRCGLLEMRKAGRAFRFMPAGGLERKLMEIGGKATSLLDGVGGAGDDGDVGGNGQ